MRAIQVSKTGGPEALQLVDIPVPQPKPNEVLVKIHASGVNFIDVYYREGRYPASLPFISGREMAGVVTEVGSGVTNFRTGEHVAQTGVMGSYAEYQCVPSDQLVHVPESVTLEQAAASMLQGATMHYLMRSTYPLRAGETALVHAAAGGMGLLLTQLGKIIGATIIGTASTEEKLKLARKAGADHVINYSEQDWVAEVKRITGGKGVDVVYDGVGKTTFDGSLSVLRPRGYMVLFGGASGAVPPFDPIRLMQLGSLFLTRPNLTHHMLTPDERQWRMTEVFNLVASKKLNIHIGKLYPLEQAQQAHRDLEARKTTGKVLLLPS
jgi:NADPH:quinone reductase